MLCRYMVSLSHNEISKIGTWRSNHTQQQELTNDEYIAKYAIHNKTHWNIQHFYN